MKRKHIRFATALMAVLVAGFILPTVALSAPAHQFSVRATIPENQIDTSQTYYDLYMEQGQKQTLQLAVDNSGDKDIMAKVSLNTASTGSNGTVLYNVAGQADESMALSVAEIARVLEPEVVVPAKGRSTVNIRVEMPEDQVYDGTLLGGVVVTAETLGEEEAETQATGVTLETAFEYVVGLKITQTDASVRPDFHLKSITPGLVNHRTALVVNLQNSEAALAKNMKVLAQVTKAGENEAYRELKLDNAEMAPNSNGDFVVDWQTALQAGNYGLYMRVEHEGETWEWNETFAIDGQTAGQANGNAVNVTGRSPWLYFALAIGLILLLWLVYWLGKRSKKERPAV